MSIKIDTKAQAIELIRAATDYLAESNAPTPQPPREEIECKNMLIAGLRVRFSKIPGGTFLMGDNAHPHSVTVKPFYMAQYPCTQSLFRVVMRHNPSKFQGLNHPVGQVSVDDAHLFVDYASYQSNYKLRLPTEAEWEYACRAGTTTANYSPTGNIDEIAWYDENSSRHTHPVGQKLPNAFGLYDMLGNVWEWIEDDWHDDYTGAPSDGSAWIDTPRASRRVCRGGSWYNYARDVRSAFRNGFEPGDRYDDLGFRLAFDV